MTAALSVTVIGAKNKEGIFQHVCLLVSGIKPTDQHIHTGNGLDITRMAVSVSMSGVVHLIKVHINDLVFVGIRNGFGDHALHGHSITHLDGFVRITGIFYLITQIIVKLALNAGNVIAHRCADRCLLRLIHNGHDAGRRLIGGIVVIRHVIFQELFNVLGIAVVFGDALVIFDDTVVHAAPRTNGEDVPFGILLQILTHERGILLFIGMLTVFHPLVGISKQEAVIVRTHAVEHAHPVFATDGGINRHAAIGNARIDLGAVHNLIAEHQVIIRGVRLAEIITNAIHTDDDHSLILILGIIPDHSKLRIVRHVTGCKTVKTKSTE